MSYAIRWYMRVLKSYPKCTQFFTTGLLMGSSDFVSQTVLEKRKYDQIEFLRIGRFSAIGTCFVGPVLYTWYNFLEKIVGNVGKSVGLRKVFLDQIIFTPCFLVCFLIVVGCLQFQSWQTIKGKINEDYFKILKKNYMLWPTAQLFTFYVCPLQMRVIFVSFVAFLWNIYLASKANQNYSQRELS